MLSATRCDSMPRGAGVLNVYQFRLESDAMARRDMPPAVERPTGPRINDTASAGVPAPPEPRSCHLRCWRASYACLWAR